MSISFNTIPASIRVPGHYIEFDNSRAVQGLPAIFHKIVVFGQRLAAGAVLANVPTRIMSGAQAEQAFGRGSMLAEMLKALKAANNYTEVWAIAQDDAGAGVAGTKTITITGAATEAGTVRLLIGGQLVEAAVANAATPTDVAVAIVAAVAANTSLPFTAANAVGVVTLTAKHKGVDAAAVDVRANYYFGDKTPAGIVMVIAAGVAGTTNPDVALGIAAMGAEHYHTWIVPYTDAANLAKFEAEALTRWGPLAQKEAQAFTAVAGTLATGTALGNTRNSQFLTILDAGFSPTPAYLQAAIVGAVDADEPDPARPRQTLLLPGILPPAVEQRRTQSERNTQLYAGISTVMIDTGGHVMIERLITTYKTNAFGVPDISYLDIETMRTIAYLRFSVRARIALKFPRHKLANDGTNFGPGQAIVTPSVIRAELISLFRQWEDAGLAENFEQFKTDLIVERSGTDPNRVDAVIPPDVINQFRVFAGQVQFRL
jgi:phage tail sheath gpL-like